jgi:sugar O-acyltransferase (sialic acid O-acetyltransferase NeuD family)
VAWQQQKNLLDTISMQFYGASGHAKVVLEAWLEAGGHVTAVFDDNEEIYSVLDFSVDGKYDPEKYLGIPLFIAIGSNTVRKNISEKLLVNFGKIVHPSAIISRTVKIGEGTIVMAGSVVNSSCQIGRQVIVNTRACVDHDSVLEDFVHIAPNATLCGDVRVCEGALVGAGSTILPQRKIGKWSVVGAGATVVDDVPEFSIVAGNPARVIRTLNQI